MEKDPMDWVPEFEYVCANDKCNYKEYNFKDPGERQCPKCKEANLEKIPNPHLETMKRVKLERGRKVWTS